MHNGVIIMTAISVNGVAVANAAKTSSMAAGIHMKEAEIIGESGGEEKSAVMA